MNLAHILFIVATWSQLFGATAAETSLLPTNTHVYKTNHRGLGAAAPVNLNQDAVLLTSCCSSDDTEIAEAEGGATMAVAATPGQSYFPVFSIDTPFVLAPLLMMMMGIFFDGKNPMVSGAVFVTTLSGQLSKNRVAAAGCPAKCEADGYCKDSTFGFCCTSEKDKPCSESLWFPNNECELNDGEAVSMGCGSCVGEDTCKDMTNRSIGSESCVGKAACSKTYNAVIGHRSCHGTWSCDSINLSTEGTATHDTTTIGTNSCVGNLSCRSMHGSTVGHNSCHNTSPTDDLLNCCKFVEYSTIGSSSCLGGKSCYGARYSTIGNLSCQTEESCYGIDNTYIGESSCQDDVSCYEAFQSTIYDNSCIGVWACGYIKYVTVESGACQGASSCKGYQWTTVLNRRMLTTEEEEDTSPPTTVVIPENTCVGDGSCEDCQYLLEKFPGRCNNELSPSDVSTEQHGNVCKLCRPLGSDEFEIDLATGGDCDWVRGHIARALENTFIKKTIKEYSQELGHLQYELKDDGEDGTCRVIIHYNPNPSDDDDADVLARIKTYVREIVNNDELMDILEEEFPNVHERISRVRIKDDDDKDGRDDGDDSTKRSKSKKAKEPKQPKTKRSKRNKSAKEKRNMDIFE